MQWLHESIVEPGMRRAVARISLPERKQFCVLTRTHLGGAENSHPQTQLHWEAHVVSHWPLSLPCPGSLSLSANPSLTLPPALMGFPCHWHVSDLLEHSIQEVHRSLDSQSPLAHTGLLKKAGMCVRRQGCTQWTLSWCIQPDGDLLPHMGLMVCNFRVLFSRNINYRLSQTCRDAWKYSKWELKSGMIKSQLYDFYQKFFSKTDALFIWKLFKSHVIALPELLSTRSSLPPHPLKPSP